MPPDYPPGAYAANLNLAYPPPPQQLQDPNSPYGHPLSGVY